MVYNQETVEKMVKRMESPDFAGVLQLSRECGISTTTLYRWQRKYITKKESIDMPKKRALEWNSVEKLDALLESSKLSEEELGKWIRVNGLHSESLRIWKQELSKILMNRKQETSKELLNSNAMIQELQKELFRKDKALAEMAALIVLKKKVEILMSGVAD